MYLTVKYMFQALRMYEERRSMRYLNKITPINHNALGWLGLDYSIILVRAKLL